MAEHGDHISCSDVVALVTDYFERALPADEVSLFEQHLNFCDGCVSYVEQMRLTAQTVGRLEEEHVPDEAKERLLQAFRDWGRAG
jgi:hypothetical protein